MKTCFDANVLLEVLLKGRKNASLAAAAILRAETSVISPLSVHLYVYFGQRDGYATADLLGDIAHYSVAAMDERTVAWAVANCQGGGFEDALQIGCAVLEGCDRFVTFDQNLAKQYRRFIDIQLLG